MFSLVIGVDRKHLDHLRTVWPTWIKHKPSLLNHPLICFRDQEDCSYSDVSEIVGEHPDCHIYSWPLADALYEGGTDKWSNPQRYKMLAGFVHCPAMWVKTPYWLKLDLDVVATGMDDWVDPMWFTHAEIEGGVDHLPAIIAHPWGYTKPAMQMWQLDQWATKHNIPGTNLDLIPKGGDTRVKSKRIISWCGFFNTQFTKTVANYAHTFSGAYKLPVPSQDGYMWYMAKRLGWPILRTQMKSRGWRWQSGLSKVTQAAMESMI